MTDNINLIPISSFLFIIITLIFSLYFTSVIKSTPCGKNLGSVFVSNFVHTDFMHLVYNLFAIFAISRIEREIGWEKFLALIIFSLTINTILETTLHRIDRNIKCSIGFSGVLYTMFTWQVITNKEFDVYMLSVIAGNILYPKLTGGNVSTSGHVIGVITGILSGVIWNYIYPNL